MSVSQDRFYVVGGPLGSLARSYVPRQADQILHDRLASGDFCYVLTTRQMGKSSLVVRVAERLRGEGVSVAVLDLTQVGQSVTPEQWYDGLLVQLGNHLHLEDELDAFWRTSALGPLQRFVAAIRQVVLPRCPGRVVVFVDEIDVVRSLPFSTDEFFAGIRECYNRRTHDPELDRLTFCLLGVATPGDLIRDSRTTPFNIGRRIELNDFTMEEAQTLAKGMGRSRPTEKKLLERVMSWTSGQPYLTQRLCDEIAHRPEVTRPRDVDQLAIDLFLKGGAKEKDDNLKFVGKRVLEVGNPKVGGTEAQLATILDLYAQVLRGKVIRDDEPNPLISTLRLSGIVRAKKGNLRISNRVYATAFDRAWVRSNLPGAEKRRQRDAFRKGLTRAIAVSAIILAAVLGTIWWSLDRYVWLKAEYYNTYVRRWGIPEGVGRLTDEAVRHRAASFKFYKRAGRVEAVEVVDAAGRLTPAAEISAYRDDGRESALLGESVKPVRWEYSCEGRTNAQGRNRLIAEAAFDRRNRRVWTFVLTPSADDRKVVGYFVTEDGRPDFRDHSTAQYFHINRNDAGHDIEIIYRDRKANFAAHTGSSDDCGRRMVVNAKGLIESYEDLSPPKSDGAAPVRLKWYDGCAGAAKRYDGLGNAIEMTYVDSGGHQNRRHNGSGRSVHTFDPWGRQIEEFHCDEQGNLVPIKTGYAGWKAEYDEEGRRIATRYFGTDRKPTVINDGYSALTVEYSPQGWPVTYRYLDVKGDPTYHKDGYSRVSEERDALGDISMMAYFGPDGQPIVRRGGYHMVRFSHDSQGRVIEESYSGLTRKPVLIDAGYCRLTRHFSDRGYSIGEEYWGLGGRRIRNKDGVACWKARLDERGNRELVEYLDELERPATHKNGYAMVAHRYDDSGKTLETRYLNEKNQLAMHKEEDRAVVTAEFLQDREIGYKDLDENRKVPNSRFLSWAKADADEKWMNLTWSYFDQDKKVKFQDQQELDFWERIRRQVRFNADKHFVPGKQSFEATFDACGRQTRISFLEDKSGRFVPGDYETVSYDNWGNETQRAFFDAKDRRRKKETEGYARITKAFDPLGHVIDEAYFDVENKPVEVAGAARIVRAYLPNGSLRREEYYNKSGKLRNNEYAIQSLTYDETGAMTNEAYWRPDGKTPVVGPKGYAQLIRRNTPLGSPLAIEYRDATGKPALIKEEGYARVEYRYNERGQKTYEAFFDAEGRPRPKTDDAGYASATWTYDEKGRRTRFTKVGMPNDSGCDQQTECYDANENLVEIRYEDKTGKLKNHKAHGYARQRKTYIDVGQEGAHEWKPSEEVFFDPDGKQTENRGTKYFKQTWSYDAEGRLIERTFRDRAGRPVLVKVDNTDRFARWTRKFKDDGSSTTELFGRSFPNPKSEAKPEELVERGFREAASGEPQELLSSIEASPDGQPRKSRRQVFDEAHPGLLRSAAYLGENGVPIVGPEGYHRLQRDWDRDGNLVQEAFFDVNDFPQLNEEGYAKTQRKYKDKNLVDEKFLGVNGELVTVRNQYARRALAYKNGRCIEERYFGPGDQLAAINGGYAMVRREFDSEGNPREEAFFDVHQKPVRSNDGFSRMVQQFTRSGNCTQREYFDADGHPVVLFDPGTGEFCAQWIGSYDDRDRLISEEFRGRKGELVPASLRCAAIQYSWNNKGDLLEARFLDGKKVPTDVVLDKFLGRSIQLSGVRSTFWGPQDERSYNHAVRRLATNIFDPSNDQPASVPPTLFLPREFGEDTTSTVWPRFVRDHLPGMDPEAAEQLFATTGARIEVHRTRDQTDVTLFDAKSGARAPRGGFQYSRKTFVYKPLQSGEKAKGWRLELDPSPTKGSSRQICQLVYLDAGGHAVLCDRGYARATLRLFDSDEQVKFDPGSGLDPLHVVEYFGLKAASPALYRNSWHSIRRWKSKYRFEREEMGSAAFFDASNKRIPVQVKVAAITQGGIAEKAKLLPGDELVKARGENILSVSQLEHLTGGPFGDRIGSISIVVRRGQHDIELKLPLAPGRDFDGELANYVGAVALRPTWDKSLFQPLQRFFADDSPAVAAAPSRQR